MAISPTIESVEKAALALQPAARAQIAHALVQSLAALPESEVADLWLAEAARRDAEMDTRQVAGIAAEEVFQRLRARYSR